MAGSQANSNPASLQIVPWIGPPTAAEPDKIVKIPYGNTPKRIFKAAQAANMEVLLECLKEGRQEAFRDGSGRTALHHAAQLGFYEVAERLLQAGFEVNAPDSYGKTPLDYAEYWMVKSHHPNNYHAARLIATYGGIRSESEAAQKERAKFERRFASKLFFFSLPDVGLFSSCKDSGKRSTGI